MKATKNVPQPFSVRKSQRTNPSSHNVHFHRLLSSATGVVVLVGYGIRIETDHGHLNIEDGIGDDRRRTRFPRVHHGLH